MTVIFYPALVPAAGDHASAVVLCQLLAWSKTAPRIYWMGHPWIVKSRAETCEATAITLDQYKRILPRLIERGWIIAERHLFHDRITPFLRLTEKATNWLAANATNACTITIEESTKEESTTVLASSSEASLTGTKFSPIHEEEQEKGEKELETVETVAKGSTEDVLPTKTKIHQGGYPKGWLMKASEILNKKHGPSSTSNLGAYWQACIAMTQTKKEYQKRLTLKEQGQLKLLSKYLGPQTKPVISYAIEHWWKFASRASAMAGCSHPSDPHIGFLLKHHAVAVNLLTPQVATPPPVVQPVQLIATGAEPETPYVPTPQELAELLEGLKAP